MGAKLQRSEQTTKQIRIFPMEWAKIEFPAMCKIAIFYIKNRDSLHQSVCFPCLSRA